AGCCNDHRNSGAGTGGPAGGRGADRRRPTRGGGAPPDPASIPRPARPARRGRVREAAAAGRGGAPRTGRRAARARRGTAQGLRLRGAPPRSRREGGGRRYVPPPPLSRPIGTSALPAAERADGPSAGEPVDGDVR